jgi:ATP-dependent helicase/nuclease subunit A
MSPVLDHPELRADDARARARALSIFDRPLFVEAGAGTGKTTTLVARIVAWCVGPGWREAESALGDRDPSEDAHDYDSRLAERVVGGVLAITFTEAAAAEMETKIRTALDTLAAGAWPRGLAEHEHLLPDLGIEMASARRRAARLGAALERRLVLTIHAWCLTLLAEHPLEVGLAPQFRVDAEGTETEDVVRETLEAALVRAFGAEPDEHWLVLARRSVGPGELEGALVTLLRGGVRAVDLERDPFTPERIGELCNSLGQSAAMFVDLALPLLEGIKGVPLVQTTLSLAEKSSDLVPAHAVRSAAELQTVCDGLRGVWDEKALKRLRQWSSGDFGVKVQKALGEQASELQRRALELLQGVERFLAFDPELSESARRVLGALLTDVQSKLRARGIASFADLLRDARDLLCYHPEIAAEVRRRTRQLLVDEFQDTDPLQCDLVRALALADSDAARGIPPPGLFVVGDPKQSIYAWRSADLAAYERFRRELTAAGGLTERLSVNYRSTPAILRHVERVIAPIMVEEQGVQPAFQPLVAHTKTGGAPVEHWVSWELDPQADKRLAETASERATRIEAGWLAEELVRRRGSSVPWNRMALLLRTASPLEIYLEALRERGIPFDVAGDKSYYRRREIIDAASLVRTVIDPLDRLSLITALRSSVIGVPDAALIPLWTSGFPAAMSALAGDSESNVAAVRSSIDRALAIMPADVPGLERIHGWEASLRDAVGKIGCLRRTFAREALDVFVERLRTLFLCEATEAARHLGAWRVANLERFFRHLSQALTSDAGDPHSVLRVLQRALSDERDAEEARPKEPQSEAVQVMTIHKSKGLDFAHVYVASMHRGSPADSIPFVDVARIDGRTEFVFFGAPSPDYGDVHARRAQHAAAERVRTLYVAMTRAEERLVLMGAWRAALVKHPIPHCETHLDLLAWSAPHNLIPALVAAADRPGARLVLEEAAYVLPPQLERFLSRAPEPDRIELDVGALESAASRLREQAAEAAARMAKAFASAVSNAARTDSVLSGASDRRSAPQAAALAGSAVHRALEDFDWQADIEGEFQRTRAGLRAAIAGWTSGPGIAPESALGIAERVFDRFRESRLFARLVALKDHVVARELALLSVPGADSTAVGYESGAIDLVYREPLTRELVIADYKTDLVSTPDEAAAHAARYAPQARAYPRMLRDALGLEHAPRFELWFLQADCVITVDPERGAANG